MNEMLNSVSTFVMNGVIGTMGAVGVVGEAPAQYPLDTMLVGFADGCEVSSELSDLWMSAARGEALVLPEASENYFGEPQIRMDSDFREIRLPVKGEWLGHAVEYFVFFAGNDNGIAVVSVRFDPADESVLDTFEPLAAASEAKLAVDPENFIGITTAFVAEGGVSQYYCDFST